MIQSFIIPFRESLEASLVIGIILGYLARTKQTRYNKSVYWGLVLGIVGSLIGAFLFSVLVGEFEGKAEMLFEGITMLTGALLMTSMILWMIRREHFAKQVEEKVAKGISNAHSSALLFLVFFSILREGVEMVIFLGATQLASSENNLIAAIAGIVAALAIGLLVFFGSLKIRLKPFFTATNILLILFASGLVAHGLHELIEAGLVPAIRNPLWNLNPAVNPDGSFPLLHENGAVGGFMKGLFGYSGDPALTEVLGYLIYAALVLYFWFRSSKANNKRAQQ